ncbi:MAG: TIGR03013 family PEP-CTERM/XrtA system glycosyltransferase [Chromatiaceae bacterium]|nr:TIGR03013 family PEP-CTERM/XrtA system glycosyltransferase [Chromatiaceae bacterium]
MRVFRHYLRLPLLFLAGLECLIFAMAFHAGLHLRDWSPDIKAQAPNDEGWLLALLVGLIYVLAMGAMGLYEASLREGLRGSLIRLALALGLGSLMLATLSLALPHPDLWRGVLLLSLALALGLVLALRTGVYFLRPGLFRRRVLVLGEPPVARRLLAASPRGLRIVGLVSLSCDPGLFQGLRCIPYDQPLRRIAARTRADEILIATDDRRGKLPMEDLLDCRLSGIEVLEPQAFFEREAGVLKLDLISPSWLTLSDGFPHGTMTALLKRLFDMLVSLLVLLLAWPLMLLTALAIRIEDGWSAPVLYRQTRVGEHGRRFEVVKFRSMRVDAEADGRARWASPNDQRITRVGRFIRTTRIDELPQLLNVLRGEMSLVGPRPERPEFVSVLEENYAYYGARHRVKPGLTGWAQLRYPYGASEEDALRKLEYDLYYVKNHSLFLDLLILIETVEVVLFGKGAR